MYSTVYIVKDPKEEFLYLSFQTVRLDIGLMDLFSFLLPSSLPQSLSLSCELGPSHIIYPYLFLSIKRLTEWGKAQLGGLDTAIASQINISTA